jgi:hypothetical protein
MYKFYDTTKEYRTPQQPRNIIYVDTPVAEDGSFSISSEIGQRIDLSKYRLQIVDEFAEITEHDYKVLLGNHKCKDCLVAIDKIMSEPQVELSIGKQRAYVEAKYKNVNKRRAKRKKERQNKKNG